jgi:hypothetical protein
MREGGGERGEGKKTIFLTVVFSSVLNCLPTTESSFTAEVEAVAVPWRDLAAPTSMVAAVVAEFAIAVVMSVLCVLEVVAVAAVMSVLGAATVSDRGDDEDDDDDDRASVTIADVAGLLLALIEVGVGVGWCEDDPADMDAEEAMAVEEDEDVMCSIVALLVVLVPA